MSAVPSHRTTVPSVPAAAAWLGAAGALPFIAGAILALVADPETGAWGVIALRGYGVAILSFMGGIHWGLAIGDAGAAAGGGATWQRLGLSVLPALVGWLALLLPQTAGLLLLAVAFAALLVGDLLAVRAAFAPSWYPRLRWPLSVVVVLCLLAATF